MEVDPNATPPVCKILDYGRYVFEQNKRAHAARKRQKQIQVKEIKLRPGTDKGDYDVKLRNVLRFLEHGDKTKITLRFRGREMVHQDLGAKLLERGARRPQRSRNGGAGAETGRTAADDGDGAAQEELSRLRALKTICQSRKPIAVRPSA